MAVAHDASSESHTGTTGSVSEASYSWTHTPAGTPKGILLFTMVHGNATAIYGDVTYGGVTLTQVPGAAAADSGGGEGGETRAWFLGSSVPTGAQTVVVNRTNNAVPMYSVAVSVTAVGDTDTAGVTLIQEDGTLAEVSVDDGSPGTNSVRYGAIMSGLSAPPAAGANSTVLQTIDFGVRVSSLIQETTAGQGSRSVGWADGTTDDRAAVLLAIVEIAGGTEHTVNPTDSAGLTDSTEIQQLQDVTDSAGLTDSTEIQQSQDVTDSAGLTDTFTVEAAGPSSTLTFLYPTTSRLSNRAN